MAHLPCYQPRLQSTSWEPLLPSDQAPALCQVWYRRWPVPGWLAVPEEQSDANSEQYTSCMDLEAWPAFPFPEDPFAFLAVWEVRSLKATSIPPRAAHFLQVPCPLASSQVAVFKPGQLADDLLTTASISEGQLLTLALTNLSMHPFTLAAGTFLKRSGHGSS